jgi:hypothetical protein
MPTAANIPLSRTRRLRAHEDLRTAGLVLGERHELVRRLKAQRALRRQFAVTAALVALALLGMILRDPRAPLFFGAACVVALALALALLLARQSVDERLLQLIASDGDDLPIRLVVREGERLRSQKTRERLASDLERFLDVAQRWEQIAPASRPIYGVRTLRFVAEEAGAVIDRLRTPPVAVRGVALTALFTSCAQGSSLASGDPVALREEFKRIRYLLEVRGAT